MRNREIWKATSNRNISDPFQCEVNTLCRIIHKKVISALSGHGLQIMIGKITHETSLGKLGCSEIMESETVKTNYNLGLTNIKESIKYYVKLYKKVLVKYNTILSENNFSYSMSDLKFQLDEYKLLDSIGHNVTGFRFVCNFWCYIEFSNSTTSDVLANIDNMTI